MGRPKGKATILRDKQIAIYVSEKEKATFEAAAKREGLTTAQWLRIALRSAAGMWTGHQEGRSMTIITSRTDLETYVDNSHPDFVEHGLRDALVQAIQAEDHPAWGADWSAWLDQHIEDIRVDVSRED